MLNVINRIRVVPKSLYMAIFMVVDYFLVMFSMWLALLLRFDFNINVGAANVFFTYWPYISALFIFFYLIMGKYRSLWRYSGIDEMVLCFISSVIFFGSLLIVSYISIPLNFSIRFYEFPKSVLVIGAMLSFMSTGFVQIAYRLFRRVVTAYSANRNPNCRRLMVVGAGAAGSALIAMKRDGKNNCAFPVVVVDDDKSKEFNRLHGVIIRYGHQNIPELVKENNINEILVAIPSASKQQTAKILEYCTKTKCTLRILPAEKLMVNGSIMESDIRNVTINDLLFRDEVKLDTTQIKEYIEDKVVLVTGGGGSIGSELCRQIAAYNPQNLVVLDIYEN